MKVKQEEEEIEGENGESIPVPQKLEDQEIEEIEEKKTRKFEFFKESENWLHKHQSNHWLIIYIENWKSKKYSLQ